MTDLNVTGDELRQIIERIESLNGEKAAVGETIKEAMSEAKSRGFDTKVIRKLIAIRKRNRDDLAEEEAILEVYMQALGMV